MIGRSFSIDAAGSGAADACDGSAAALLAARCGDETAKQGPVAGVSQDRHRDDHHQVRKVSSTIGNIRKWLGSGSRFEDRTLALSHG